jgi:electron transport complex protein RnfB
MDIYQELAHYLDDLPGGFPPTESGVDLRILRRLFTPEEAELALHLTLLPEAPRVIARRARLTADEAARRLEEMAGKGLILRLESKRGKMTYMASQYVVGIWEYQVNSLSPALIRDMEEYLPTLFDFDAWQKAPQLRTIPVAESIDTQLKVTSYERAEELVRSAKKITVAPCICRRERGLINEGCDKPLESCFCFGMGADYYERNGLGRVIAQQEALAILQKANEVGLVLQPGNGKDASFLCCCCGCCCGVLRSIKRHPRPASIVSSPFVAAANPDTCKGCGVCVKRCQMEALQLRDKKVTLDIDRCIGCGLCVSTCPTGSLTLSRKQAPEQPQVPKDYIRSLVRLARERGKLKMTSLITMLVKSGVDRLLAAR